LGNYRLTLAKERGSTTDFRRQTAGGRTCEQRG
jgi:hypothetical protein